MGKRWSLVAIGALVLPGAFAAGFWTHPQLFPPQRSDAEMAAERVKQFGLFRSDARVAMLGDSITAQGEWSELLGAVVANRGVSGDTARQVLARVGSVPASARSVFLMVGINDLPARTPTAVQAETRRIVEALAPRRVIVQSVLFTADRDLNDQVAELNRLNRAFCGTGACSYLELNDLFSRDGVLREEMTYDGTHLKGRAYSLWARRVRDTGF